MKNFTPSRGPFLKHPPPAPDVQAANNSAVFRDFFNFSQFPIERALPLAEPGIATRVEAMDMRFGTPAHPAFVATADVNSRLQVVRAWFTFGAEVRPR